MEKAIACTLVASDLAAQRDRWLELARRTQVERIELASGLRLVFGGGTEVAERLEELVAVERECCAFADWSVTAHAGWTELDVTSEGDAVSVLHGMFRREADV